MLLLLFACGTAPAEPPHFGRWQTFTVADGLPSDKILCIHATPQDVWAGTDRGLARYRRGSWQSFSPKDGLAHRAVLYITEDPDTGDLWCATMGGLSRYSGGRFDTFTQLNSGLVNDVVYGVHAQGGEVWAATAAGVSRYQIAEDRWTIYDQTNTPMHEIWCYSVTGDGEKIYVAVWGGGLLEYDPQGDRWRDYTDPDGEMEIDLFRNDGLVHDVVASVACDTSGRVWAGTYFGLSSYDGRKWRNFMNHDSPLASNFINSLRAHGEYCWIATDNGLNACDRENWWTYRRDPATGKGTVTWKPQGGDLEQFETETIFPHNYIMGASFQGDDIWLATEKGVARGQRTTAEEYGSRRRHAKSEVTSPRDVPVPVSSDVTYGKTPLPVIPFRDFQEPYHRFFQTVMEFRGAGREEGKGTSSPATAWTATRPSERAHLTPSPEAVRIGFMGPVGETPDSDLGKEMLEGVQLALEEANAGGGYEGIPFELIVRPDLGLWGAASNVMAAFRYEDDVLAVIGSIDGANTHIALRVALKTSMVIVNTAVTDPTLTETNVPWIIRCMSDDRQQGYALAHHIFNECGIESVAALRVNDRFGRTGIAEFRDAARRLGHPLRAELRWRRGDRDFSAQLDRIRETGAEAIVLWGNAMDAAAAVREIRRREAVKNSVPAAQPPADPAAAGSPLAGAVPALRVFGCDRLVSRAFLEEAGSAAEGLVAVAVDNPTRDDPRRRAFVEAFTTRFGREPGSFAAHAYDGANMLFAAIRRAGLNRVLIRDALYEYKQYDGVTGAIEFDTTLNDVGPVYIATVEGGRFVYEEAAYATSTGVAHARIPYRTLSQSPPEARSPVRTSQSEQGGYALGCFLPLDDAGQAVVSGAQRALADDAALHPDERPIKLLVRDSRAAWGAGSNALTELVFDAQVLALIGSTERLGTHLAETLAAKFHFPVVTLCGTDPTITRIPLPWIFSIAPAGADEDQDFARHHAQGDLQVDSYSALGYDAATLLANRIRAGGDCRQKLRSGIAEGGWYHGASGIFRFDALGNRIDLPCEDATDGGTAAGSGSARILFAPPHPAGR